MPEGNPEGKTYQPPTGGRDLLPLDVVQKRWIEDRLEEVFCRWGYHRIITSTVETMDTLMAGGAIERIEVLELQMNQLGGQRLGLRPELTASIARAAVTRLASVTYPQRLYYNANVFRRSATGTQGGQQEYHQAGIELLGSSSLMADIEVLLLVADCLSALNLSDTCIVLGEAALTYSLLSPFPEERREAVRQSIAKLDRVALSGLALSDDLRSLALRLMDLRGAPDEIFAKLANFDLDEEQRVIAFQLKSLIDLLNRQRQQGASIPSVILDLSLIRPFDYYTGIVFEVINGAQRVGQGGRYDDLLSVYDPVPSSEGFPGIGFVLNIEQLHRALLPDSQMPKETPPSDWLIVPRDENAVAAALSYAQKARESANVVRVEMSLDLNQSPDEVRAIAHKRKINQIAWISDQGLPDIEIVN
ncbi:tRNA synthetase class II core domain (G, H, P, S and T) protein [Synechococcus sp. PCC 7335]|uniref:ATP phosphoribosyltransferase regulatory subunit n=1 Tax=Synechococcus sp. (strain ATCC 29403 / PCC 7335) TaxID=91464 RepID=UPI00017ECAAD|nr:ATP phosphoribosyltransferase regulatory subunit [Synechococcus sp. PCC 7335]EDX87550.1 tRNA synthetase class II core domain (G, H, P, S and T) protein [Synechococcus sp. PCC 7335]